MNIALIHQFDIAWMVSKESGRAGGFLEKYQAAKETGCRMIVIGRPKEEQGMELEKCIEYLDRRFLSKENVANDAKIESVNTDTENIENIENIENPGSGQEKVAQEPVMQEAATQNTEAVTEGEETEDILQGQKVSLVGIGMGTADTLTQEGKQALECADLLIGAARMVEHIRKPGQEVWPDTNRKRSVPILRPIRSTKTWRLLSQGMSDSTAEPKNSWRHCTGNCRWYRKKCTVAYLL